MGVGSMAGRFANSTQKNKLARFLMILSDVIMANFAYLLGLLLRFYVKFEFQSGAAQYIPKFFYFLPIYAVICIGVFYVFKLYNTVWKFAGLKDLNRILLACLVTGALHALGITLLFGKMPLTYYFLGPIIQFVFITISRFAYKYYLSEHDTRTSLKYANKNAAIIGIDEIAQFAVRHLNESKTYRTVCLLDATNTDKEKKYVNGIPVLSLSTLETTLDTKKISYVVIADQALSEEDKKTITETCDAKGIEVDDFVEYIHNNNASFTPVSLKTNETGARVIPFSPPDITEAEISEVKKALKSGWITTGPRTKELEKRLAAFCNTSKVVCLNSATAAEELNFRICGIGEGDEVIVPAYTYSASASSAIHCGAKVIFVDSQKDNCEMDYDKVAAAITEKTKAIVAVDLGGIIADYDKLFDIVEKKKELFVPKAGNDLGARIQQAVGRVLVFADCAHALGATRNGKHAGEIADFTDFSFHAVKNFTTAEGGASTWRDIDGIDNDEIYHQYQLFSLHGQSKDALAKSQIGAWEYDIIGPWYKCNMTDVMAAIGLRQLDRYPALMERRKEIIHKYDEVCDKLGINHLIHYTKEANSSGHLYLTRIPGINDQQRREIIVKLAECGVSTNVHYKPLPMMTAYRQLGWDIKDFPNAYNYYENLITLPLHTKLSDGDVDYIIDIFERVVKPYLNNG